LISLKEAIIFNHSLKSVVQAPLSCAAEERVPRVALAGESSPAFNAHPKLSLPTHNNNPN